MQIEKNAADFLFFWLFEQAFDEHALELEKMRYLKEGDFKINKTYFNQVKRVKYWLYSV